jgi:hypothetical protein
MNINISPKKKRKSRKIEKKSNRSRITFTQINTCISHNKIARHGKNIRDSWKNTLVENEQEKGQ